MKWRVALQSRWQASSRREQGLVLSAIAVVGVALLWWVALAPALAVLKTADALRQSQDVEFQHMQRLQQQARTLMAQPTLNEIEARRALEGSLKILGESAGIGTQMDRLVITLKGAQAQPLVQWLANVRQNVQLVPQETRLKRNPAGSWDGTVVFVIPVP